MAQLLASIIEPTTIYANNIVIERPTFIYAMVTFTSWNSLDPKFRPIPAHDYYTITYGMSQLYEMQHDNLTADFLASTSVNRLFHYENTVFVPDIFDEREPRDIAKEYLSASPFDFASHPKYDELMDAIPAYVHVK